MNFPNCPRCGAEGGSADGWTVCEECQRVEKERRLYELEHPSLQIAIRERDPEDSSK